VVKVKNIPNQENILSQENPQKGQKNPIKPENKVKN
jgi:hypothetical protein